MTEMSKDSPGVAGGTSKSRDRERQTAVARERNNSSKEIRCNARGSATREPEASLKEGLYK